MDKRNHAMIKKVEKGFLEAHRKPATRKRRPHTQTKTRDAIRTMQTKTRDAL